MGTCVQVSHFRPVFIDLGFQEDCQNTQHGKVGKYFTITIYGEDVLESVPPGITLSISFLNRGWENCSSCFSIYMRRSGW